LFARHGNKRKPNNKNRERMDGMQGVSVTEAGLLKMINLAYAAADDGEMMHAVFKALGELVSFSSGVFMPVDPATLELQSGVCFDCNMAAMDLYLAHYAPMDPFVQRQPGPAALNQSMLLSNLITVSELAHSEFSDFQRQVPYRHAIGMLTGVAKQPVAAFSVHRQSGEPDFSREEVAVLNCIGPHLARAVVLRRLACDPVEFTATGIAVFTRAARTLYLNGAARRLLGKTSPLDVLAVIAERGSGVISVGSKVLRLSTLPWSAASLLRPFALEESAAISVDDRQSAIQVGDHFLGRVEHTPDAIIVAVRAFCPRTDLTRRLAQYSLSRRQAEIAAWALRGLTNAEIADQVNIGVQTVREHFQEIYCRIGVRSRSELMARVLGTNGSTRPQGRGKAN